MKNKSCARTDLEEKLDGIEINLKEIREDVSQILTTVQDELEALRERDFWGHYSKYYREE